MKANELVEILTRAQKEELFRIMTRRNPVFHAEPVYKHFYRMKLKKAKGQVAEIKKILAKI